MKKISHLAIALLGIGIIYKSVNATAVNPMSNVLADDTNVASTLVIRDANGGFSAGAITATTPNASSTGTIISGSASQTADLLQIRNSAGAVKTQIGAQGQIRFSTHTLIGVNTLTPDFKGALIQVINHTSVGAVGTGVISVTGAYVVCEATGTAVAQFAVEKGTGGVNMSGCGTGL